MTAITVLRSTGSTFEPLYIAQDQGYFKAAGLDVTIKPGAADTSQNAPSVLNDEAQFAMTDSSGILKAASSGLPIQIVSGLQSSDLSVAPSDGLVVKADSPITSFADVAGKTIGLPSLGGTLQFICEYSAKAAGVDPSKIKFVALPLTSLNDAVAKGQVDGAYLFATFIDAAKAAGMKVIGKGTNALPGLPQATLFASTKYLQANAGIAQKFADAVGKGIDYANAHPAAVRAVDTKYTQLPAAYVAGRSIQPFSAKINTSVMQTVADNMLTFGLIKKSVDTKTAIWAQAPTTSN
jgi:NitT/TauT family transport system substrate-binding protein